MSIKYLLSLPSRWFHRRGFGAQSPWAFDFITEVLYSPHRYYFFDELPGKKTDEQLFRISKWLKVGHVELHSNNSVSKAYIVAPIKKNINDHSTLTLHYYDEEHSSDLLNDIDNRMFGENSSVIVDGIRDKNEKGWSMLLSHSEATSIFDMGRRGIVFFDPRRQKQIYLT